MKSIELTDDELRTLVWALQGAFADTVKARSAKQLPIECGTTERIVSISGKAYYALTHSED